MNILHVTPYYAPAFALGGVVRVVTDLTREQIRLGHDVSVLTTDALTQAGKRAPLRKETLKGVRVVRVANALPFLRRVNLSSPVGFSSPLKALVAWCDVIHLHEFRTVEAWLTLQEAHRAQKPVLLSPHGTLALHTGRGLLKRVWDFLLSRRMVRQVHRVIALTEQEKSQVIDLWNALAPQHPPQVVVLPNGVSVSHYRRDHLPPALSFRQQWGIQENERVLLYMGRLHPRKGADKLAEAFLRANLSGVRLVIAGADEGLYISLKALAAHDNRLIVTGHLDETARLSALACADVMALPAVGEGLPMAVLEAMSASVPVLLSPECHLPDVEQVGAGWIVEPTVDALTQALLQIFSPENALDWGQIRHNAHAYVQAHFALEDITRRLLDIYAGAIQAR